MIQRDPQLIAPARLDALPAFRHVWLVGIEGVGLSGTARLLTARGHQVGGVDRTPGPRAQALARMGVSIGLSEAADALPRDVDLVVRSAAIPDGHPQVGEARRRGLPVWKYAELLGALMEDRVAVCVAGCHGKTTTSSLLASVLLHAERDPSFVIGGDLRAWATGARAGSGPHFVAESCEFDRSFLQHRPTVAIVTNVDEDHLDYYRDLGEIQEAFRQFAARLPADGTLIAHESCAPLFQRHPAIQARVLTYGTGARADWQHGRERPLSDWGGMRFRVRTPRGVDAWMRLPMDGAHNVANATAAVAALATTGLGLGEIASGLAAFGGVGRRLEFVATCRGIDILDDYGHHPTEIEAVLQALRSRYGDRRLVVVFQPHQASRTRCLMGDFATVLAKADRVWMPPIYFARDSEAERRAVTSEDLADRIRAVGGRATAWPDMAAVVQHAEAHLQPGDVLVTMGAGDVDEVAHGLAAQLSEPR